MPVVDGQRGRAFDFRDRPIDARELAATIQDGSVGDGEATTDRPDRVDVRCPQPGPVHERVGIVEPGRSYPLQAALAVAARTLGHESSVATELADLRARLGALDPPGVTLEDERRRVAATDDAAALEEEVATLGGQLDAARERGDDLEALAEARERAVADLTERPPNGSLRSSRSSGLGDRPVRPGTVERND